MLKKLQLIGCFLCAGDCANFFSYIISFYLHNSPFYWYHPYFVDEKAEAQSVRELVEFMSIWQSWHSTPGQPVPYSTSLPTALHCTWHNLDDSMALTYLKIQSDQSLRRSSEHSSTCTFYNFPVLSSTGMKNPVLYRALMANVHATQRSLIWSFHLCKQGCMDSGRLWLIRQLWNLFRNLLISWQEWAMASQEMESSEHLPKSQTQMKPKCLCWVWVITLFFWLLQSQRCLSFHSSRPNEWQIKVSQTCTLQGGASRDWLLI